VPGSVPGASVAIQAVFGLDTRRGVPPHVFALDNRPAPDLTLSRTVSPNAVKVAAAAGTDSLTVTVTVSGAGSGTAEVSGEHAGVPFQWSGPVNLAGNPRAELAAAGGYDPDAFTAPLEQAAYFGPACQALVNQPSAAPTQTERKVVALDTTSAGSFGVQAMAWGLGTACGAAATAGAPLTFGVSQVAGLLACGAGSFALAEAADYLANGDLSDLAAPIDVNAVLEQIQNQQAAGPQNLPEPVETVTGRGGEQVGPSDGSDGSDGGGGSGEGPDGKPGVQPQ
jgi:hypothetical protein